MILAGILSENETETLPEPQSVETITEKQDTEFEEDTIKFLDEVTELITKLSNNIKAL